MEHCHDTVLLSYFVSSQYGIYMTSVLGSSVV